MSETPMKKQTLLIGINEYQILPELKYARQDAESIEQALKQNYCFSDDEVMLLTDAKPGLFKPSNRRIIEKHLEKLAKQDLDLFIFGFWGHGLFRNGQRYFCPLDAISEDIEEMGLSFDSLQRLLSNIRAKNTCIILDCCQTIHNRGDEETLTTVDRTVMENMARDIVLKRQEMEPEFVSNVAILNSCKEGQAAYEWDNRKHGIFTAHLLDAMNGRFDSVAQIVGYISKNVEKTAMELGKMQTPLCHLEGDITLPVDTRPKPTPPQPQQQSTSKSNVFKLNVVLLALVAFWGTLALFLLTTQSLYLLTIHRDNTAEVSSNPESSKMEDDINAMEFNAVNPEGDVLETPDVPAEQPVTSEKPVEIVPETKEPPLSDAPAEQPVTSEKPVEIVSDIQQTLNQFNQLPAEGTKAGERVVVTFKGVEFAFRWCPAGKFTMGAPLREYGRFDNETPHQVTLTKGFWMMETEVTQKQWKTVMGNNPSYFKDNDHPVEKVSWDDCQKFCKKTGLSLPTEAQWEYACRAGTKGAYAGDIDKMAWYHVNATHSVKTKESNAWGLYDMSGNVWEWCQDWYGYYPNRSVKNPAGPPNDSYRVVRGGSWSYNSERCRSAGRDCFDPEERYNDLGFRCVKVSTVNSAEPDTENPELDTDNPEAEESATSEVPEESFPDVQQTFDQFNQLPAEGTKAGERAVVTYKGVEFAFRWCPADTFEMGSPSSESGHNSGETQHRVTLTKGFWMLETEVTQKQWKAVMEKLPNCGFKGDDLPVERVSWNDCQDFCKKCTQLGLAVQLPTEEQWEYACRAGTTGAYAGILDDMAWYVSNSNNKTHPVGTKKANAWGLYDMHGNVWEWCQDWYEGISSRSVPASTEPLSGSFGVVRGGSWFSIAEG